MTNTSHTLPVEDEVDLYINGKLTEQQEIEFEARYLESPELLHQVELAQQLKQGLAAANSDGGLTPTRAAQPFLHKLSRYFWVPQTAVGALAAILLIAPLALLNRTAGVAQLPSSAALDSELVIIGSTVLRGASNMGETEKPLAITLDASKPWVTLAFEVPPSLGRPIAWQIALSDADGSAIYMGEPQFPNGRSIVSVTINLAALVKNSYSYRITPQQSQQSAISGTLLLQR